jgi:hypothetical protein
MKRRILILAANPVGTGPLRLDEEVCEIQLGLLRSIGESVFEIHQAWAPRPRDVRRALLDYSPEFVHFCGHGAGDEGLIFENECGEPHLISTEALSGLFELFSSQIKCVVLNACYSELQARAIAQHIEAVVGMQRAIGDHSAIEFAIGFYDAIAASRTPSEAFRFGCNAIQLAGAEGHLIPSLLLQSNITKTAIGPNSQLNMRPTAVLSGTSRSDRLMVADLRGLTSSGWTMRSIMEATIEMDYENVAGLDERSEGAMDQWVAIAESNPDTHALVLNPNNEIVGYWHFEALHDDLFEKSLRGELEDAEITVDKVRFFCAPGIYNLYFIIFCVMKQYRSFRVNRMLVEALLIRLEEFAEEGILIHRISANAFTKEGIGLCRSLGMRYLRPHCRFGEIYYLDLRDSPLIKARPRLFKALSALS